MLELELQQYLLREYPQENARCEWKEFKNLKNSFCGNEKDDVISYVSAIANMEGGHLVIGVRDKTLEIVGTDTYSYDRQKAILRLTERCLRFIINTYNQLTFAPNMTPRQGPDPLDALTKLKAKPLVTTTHITTDKAHDKNLKKEIEPG